MCKDWHHVVCVAWHVEVEALVLVSPRWAKGHKTKCALHEVAWPAWTNWECQQISRCVKYVTKKRHKLQFELFRQISKYRSIPRLRTYDVSATDCPKNSLVTVSINFSLYPDEVRLCKYRKHSLFLVLLNKFECSQQFTKALHPFFDCKTCNF